MYLTFFSFEYYNCLTWTIFEKTNITCIVAVTMSNATNETMITASTHCPSSAVTISLTMLIFLTGVLGNAIVIAYVRRERRAKKKPNIVLLFQMALNNLLALCTSLPLHLILAELVPTAILPMRLGNMLCAIRPLSSYVFVKVGLLTLTGICVDRYEMFTRLRKPKTLTAEFTKKFVVASWLTAFATSTCVCYGYIQKGIAATSLLQTPSGLGQTTTDCTWENIKCPGSTRPCNLDPCLQLHNCVHTPKGMARFEEAFRRG